MFPIPSADSQRSEAEVVRRLDSTLIPATLHPEAPEAHHTSLFGLPALPVKGSPLGAYPSRRGPPRDLPHVPCPNLREIFRPRNLQGCVIMVAL